MIKRRKRRQLCWFPVSIVLLYVPGPFFTCTQKKITIQMTSMAAALAASLPAAISRQATPQPAAQQPSKVPQRLEGVVDVEAAREVENVSLSSLVSRLVLCRRALQDRVCGDTNNVGGGNRFSSK